MKTNLIKRLITIAAATAFMLAIGTGAVHARDNGNGTYTDATGLVWLKDAGCLGSMNWVDATASPKNLAHGKCGLSDNSRPGSWRLPTGDELNRIHQELSGFTNIRQGNYWSSSCVVQMQGPGWGMPVTLCNSSSLDGHPYSIYSREMINKINYVLPVRAGQ
ncbi:Protein of unknown function [Trichlorobacter thiogenes]|uniref:DUF1566 domain-containing protein n=1 Tax=Trichlorobacter thiogenes TaxID=115783 RepID=A0A1T4Q4E7_9BACT|nr:DUF1566 domain-containing protein [Trichlorobacter thiogenes]SJZ98619.1 Protein of unknown function [Trichlorobacter thiogenes]